MNNIDLMERYGILKFVITKYEITGNLESEWGTVDDVIQEINILQQTILDRMKKLTHAKHSMEDVKN